MATHDRQVRWRTRDVIPLEPLLRRDCIGPISSDLRLIWLRSCKRRLVHISIKIDLESTGWTLFYLLYFITYYWYAITISTGYL